MTKLTATGQSFGEAKGEIPSTVADSVWNSIKGDILNSESFKNLKKAYLETPEMFRSVLDKMMRNTLKDCFPENLSEEDYKRYMDEILEHLNGSD